MKLYFVQTRGMTHGITTGQVCHGQAYVIANDAESAYLQLKKYLDDQQLGYDYERELKEVTLIAETGNYPKCATRLFIEETENILDRKEQRN